MRNEKLLFLEASWGQDDEYISDSRSCSRVYRGVEALMSTQKTPILTIARPLLACRFPQDIRDFVALDCNKKGVNVVILSGHGTHEWVPAKDKRVHKRVIQAIDGEINVSVKIRQAHDDLKRTIIILDSCGIGLGVKSFQKASGALGVIGFSATVGWIDSVVFIFALLLHFQQDGVFQMERLSAVRPKKILQKMMNGPYAALMNELGMESSF